MSASRNLGLRKAQGSHVSFLDGDDVYLPERLMAHVRILEGRPEIAMVISDHVRWRSWESDQLGARHDIVRPFFSVGDQWLEAPLGFRRILEVPFLVAGICNITVRRQVALGVGGFVDRFQSLYEDQAFVARVSLRHAIYFHQAYLARYRYHAGSATGSLKASGSQGSERMLAYTRSYYDWLIESLVEAGFDADSELTAIARARRAACEPTVLRRLSLRGAALTKAVLGKVLPDRWHAELLRVEQILKERSARRGYERLARRLSIDAARKAEHTLRRSK